MVGGVKAIFAVLLALVLVLGGAKVLSGQGVIDEKKHGGDHHPDHGHSHSHHNHHQAPPLLEMLPPIGLAGMAIRFAIPNLMRGRAIAARTACFSNQRTIRTTIQQWATDKRKGGSDSPSEDDVKGYFEGEKLPLCPAGGTYDLATVGDYPSCNKHGCYIDEEETE